LCQTVFLWSGRWLLELAPILGLLAVVALVLRRLPRVELGHSQAFLRRRMWNWLPLGLTYALLYMARYNLDVAKNAGLMDKADLGMVSAIGMWVYGVSFVVNGPLTDRLGGRLTILIAATGAAVTNLLMGAVVLGRWTGAYLPDAALWFGALYGANMYFQSFGAVSIVKVNAQWFHLRERGTFGGIFGILISLGIYFAYDWNRRLLAVLPLEWIFFVPALLLLGFAIIDAFLVFDRPSDSGHPDFDTADASSGESGPALGAAKVFGQMLRHPIVMTIAAIELVSGCVRGGVMKWSYVFLKETGQAGSFVYENWGMLLCCAGVLGGVVAGTISDRWFESRRGPSAGLLYGLVVLGLTGAAVLITSPAAGFVFVLVMMAIIGVHGMLSGTASMDFGGTRNAGVAVGIIDGFVYLGNGLQSIVFGRVLPGAALQRDPSSWRLLPLLAGCVAVIGLLLCTRIWHARPGGSQAR
jgi:OPA family glycerol-3-phosphate transporter-like MFS transporter